MNAVQSWLPEWHHIVIWHKFSQINWHTINTTVSSVAISSLNYHLSAHSPGHPTLWEGLKKYYSEIRRLFKKENLCMPWQPTFNMTGSGGFEPGWSSPRSEMESSKEYGLGLSIVLNNTVEKVRSWSHANSLIFLLANAFYKCGNSVGWCNDSCIYQSNIEVVCVNGLAYFAWFFSIFIEEFIVDWE